MAVMQSLEKALPESLRRSTAVSSLRRVLRILDNSRRTLPDSHIQFSIDRAEETMTDVDVGYAKYGNPDFPNSCGPRQDSCLNGIGRNKLDCQKVDRDFGVFRGLLFALPISLLLWVIIIAIARSLL